MHIYSLSEPGYIACGRWDLGSSASLVAAMTHWIDSAQCRIQSCSWAVHPSPCFHIHLDTHADSVPYLFRNSPCDGPDGLFHSLREGHLHVSYILPAPRHRRRSVCLFDILSVIMRVLSLGNSLILGSALYDLSLPLPLWSYLERWL